MKEMAKANIEIVSFPQDQRGFVLEPLGADLIAAQKNVHVAMTEPGAIRGNHYHEHGTEIAVAVGPALVRLREDGVIRDVNVPAGEAYRFTLPPRVGHAFQNTGTKTMLLVAFNTAVFDAARPDVIRDTLIPNPGPA
jgi:UDP-2-acetamido-2,6-beta-L-arabino-hexul-4-ose reductase